MTTHRLRRPASGHPRHVVLKELEPVSDDPLLAPETSVRVANVIPLNKRRHGDEVAVPETSTTARLRPGNHDLERRDPRLEPFAGLSAPYRYPEEPLRGVSLWAGLARSVSASANSAGQLDSCFDQSYVCSGGAPRTAESRAGRVVAPAVRTRITRQESVNVVCLTGHLTAAPEFRPLVGAEPVCLLRLAVPRRAVRTGALEPGIVHVTVLTGRGAIEPLTMGSGVAVVGLLELDPYFDQGGQPRLDCVVIADSVELLDAA